MSKRRKSTKASWWSRLLASQINPQWICLPMKRNIGIDHSKRSRTERFLFSRSHVDTDIDIDWNSIRLNIHWERVSGIYWKCQQSLGYIAYTRILWEVNTLVRLPNFTLIRMFRYLSVLLTVDFLPMKVIEGEEEHWKANVYERDADEWGCKWNTSLFLISCFAKPALWELLMNSIRFLLKKEVHDVRRQDYHRVRDSSGNVLILLFEKRSTWTTTTTTTRRRQPFPHLIGLPSSQLERIDIGQVLLPLLCFCLSLAAMHTDNENNWGQMQSCAPSADGRRLLYCQEQLFIISVLIHIETSVSDVNLRSREKRENNDWTEQSFFTTS